jgi:hypothetical protein
MVSRSGVIRRKVSTHTLTTKHFNAAQGAAPESGRSRTEQLVSIVAISGIDQPLGLQVTSHSGTAVIRRKSGHACNTGHRHFQMAAQECDGSRTEQFVSI